MTRIAGVGDSTRVFDGQRRDFIVMRKDTFNYTGTYTYVNDAGTELDYDFTGCIGAMAIKKKKADTTAVRIVSVSFDEDEYTLYVEADDMDMDAGKYYYDLQIFDADSEMVTKMYGSFVVLQDITDMREPNWASLAVNMDTAVTYEKGEVIKDNFFLNSYVAYVMGKTISNEQKLVTLVSYAFGLGESQSLVMSSNVIYQFVTTWGTYENIMSTFVSYLIGLVGDYEYVMQTNCTYIIISVS